MFRSALQYLAAVIVFCALVMFGSTANASPAFWYFTRHMADGTPASGQITFDLIGGPGIDGLNAHYHLFHGLSAQIGAFTLKSDLEFYITESLGFFLYGFTNMELTGGPPPGFLRPDRVDFIVTDCPGRGLSLELRPDLPCNLSGFRLTPGFGVENPPPSPPFGFVTIDSLAVPGPPTVLLMLAGLVLFGAVAVMRRPT
jgi:hypothetical protein